MSVIDLDQLILQRKVLADWRYKKEQISPGGDVREQIVEELRLRNALYRKLLRAVETGKHPETREPMTPEVVGRLHDLMQLQGQIIEGMAVDICRAFGKPLTRVMLAAAGASFANRVLERPMAGTDLAVRRGMARKL